MNVALLSIVSYVTSEIDSSLLTRKSNFRNDKTLGLLSFHWSPKLYATSGFWKEVAGLSFCVAFVLGFVGRSSDGSSKEGRVRVFCGVSHLLPLITQQCQWGTYGLLVLTNKMNSPWVNTVS